MEYAIGFNNLKTGYNGEIIGEFPDIRLKGTGVVSVIGKNGAGKTSLFKTMLKEIKPVSGSIYYGGAAGASIDALSLEELARLQCFIPQTIPAATKMSTLMWCVMGRCARDGFVYALPTKHDKDIIYTLGEMVKFPYHLFLSQVDTLSGGELRKAAVVRALAQNSNIVILDELYSQMDLDAAESTRELLRGIGEQKLIIQSTHCLQTAVDMSDKILALTNRGKAVLLDPTDATPSVLEDIYGMSFQELNATVMMAGNDSWVTHRIR